MLCLAGLDAILYILYTKSANFFTEITAKHLFLAVEVIYPTSLPDSNFKQHTTNPYTLNDIVFSQDNLSTIYVELKQSLFSTYLTVNFFAENYNKETTY